MGNTLQYPVNTIHTTSQTIPTLKWCHSCLQGYRATMEDNWSVITDLYGNGSNVSLFAVFDGHSGDSVSEYLAKNIARCITENITAENLFDKNNMYNLENVMEYIDIEINAKILESGSTAILAFVREETGIVVNIGDSRCVLVRNGKIKFQTVDHKPDNIEERKRIHSAGGTVLDGRVDGTLALSRAYGDFKYKENSHLPAHKQKVIATPTISYINVKTNDYLLLYCDGLIEEMSNEALVKCFYKSVSESKNIETACESLLNESLERGSKDNMSIICINFTSNTYETNRDTKCVLKSQSMNIDSRSIDAFKSDFDLHGITLEQFKKMFEGKNKDSEFYSKIVQLYNSEKKTEK